MAQTKIGMLKVAAGKCGASLAEYIKRKESGEKHCRVCRKWKPTDEFNVDRSRYDGFCALCRECHKQKGKEEYVQIPAHLKKPLGPKPDNPRDGDKLQARARVNKLVKNGRLPRPSDMPCSKCNDFKTGRRHEYHHWKGYGSRNHLDVIVLCVKCHRTAK